MSNSIRQALKTDDINLAVLKVLADNSFDSILITDATKAGKIIYTNKAFKKLSGYGHDEVIGKTPRLLQGTGTDKKVIEELRTALLAGRKFEGKAINFKKGGTPFIMHWRVLPVKVSGKIRAWVAIQRETSSL